jgi:capsular polysaccharide export protein
MRQKDGVFYEPEIRRRVRVFAEDISPQSLLRHMQKVYVVTSQYGFEALLAGKPVVCFGQPWYAGWGLTDDRHPKARACRTPTTDHTEQSVYRRLFALLPLPTPGKRKTSNAGLRCRLAVLQRNHSPVRRGTLWAPGLSLWKTAILKPFLKTAENRVRFAKQCRQASALIAWGTEKKWQAQADAQRIPLWRMEDGFIRSSGLGSDLLAPLSLVLDKTGIYYDASRPSDLENLLNASSLSEHQRERASPTATTRAQQSQ